MIGEIEAINEDTVVLHLSNDLKIDQSGELKEALLTAFDQGKTKIVIDVEKVTDLDITCLQLFCAAHLTAVKKNRQLILKTECSDAVREIIRETGFIRQSGCSSDQESKTCLWANEK